MSNRGNHIQTYMGLRFYPFDPKPIEIHLKDIAHHLSHICRFGGSTLDFYSVAQHSVLVSECVEEGFEREGLFHDAAETYIGDMINPIKRDASMWPYRGMEEMIQAAVDAKFALRSDQESFAAVKKADNIVLITEGRDLLSCQPDWFNAEEYAKLRPLHLRIKPLPPKAAEVLFLKRYRELFT